MHVVLVEPEIPQNTGNAARTCVMTATKLHLVEPLGFSIADKEVRRSGLDYWQYLNLEVHRNFKILTGRYPESRMICFSTKGTSHYHSLQYLADDFLVFGSETKGLGPDILQAADYILRIPMVDSIPRSLNLGNAVALVLYEALRQLNFPGMQ